MATTSTPRAAPEERERLIDLFVRLCEIVSPSRTERAMADAVTAELQALGLEVTEDLTQQETGSDAGNLLARIPGPEGTPTILLCAHLDTVPVAGPIEVTREEGTLTNRHAAILGADNKAAVAAILAAARHFQGFGGPAPVGIELLFTTCEEQALLGAKAFDQTQLRADFGFVFDHATPLGEVILAAPTYFRVEGRFQGTAAHAGMRPEKGRSAITAAARALARMQLGRIDHDTTANAGRIEGGTAANVVAERCRIDLEARSVDHERAAAVVSDMIDTMVDAAGETECDVETVVEESFRGYRLTRGASPVQAATAALEGLGIEPRFVQTGGGSDANVFNDRGLCVVNVADGSERNHQPDECMSVAALESLFDVVLGIVSHSREQG